MSTSTSMAAKRWWKEAVIYQIYPASFKDTDGDGIGNINGITEKLDYLKKLGVDVLWLSPIYESPQKDMGYDISDYTSIHPRYGNMDDVFRLIGELKKRDMKLVMDLVVNHTSDQHPWFVESASSTDNAKRDWYIWRGPKYDAEGNRLPPNNWSCLLDDSQSAWTYHPATGEYYLSIFSSYQPDLNWENPLVRRAVQDILRFWIDKGVSGFRMDVINLISKDQRFPDVASTNKTKPYHCGHAYFANGPRLSEYLQEMKDVVLSKHDLITVGEMPFLDDEKQILEMIHAEEGALNMVFTFEMMGLDCGPAGGRFSLRPWLVRDLRKLMTKTNRLVMQDGWNALYIENHDQPRSVSRFCDDSDEYREVSAKLLCLMQTTLPGTLYIYQGEELGMRNVPATWGPEEFKDIESVNYWKHVTALHPPNSPELARARDLLRRKARDNSRTPMQWDATPNGGFCPADVTPWMRVNDDYPTCNAAAQVAAGGGGNDHGDHVPPYRFWQRALQIRKELADLFVYGRFEVVEDGHPSVFAFTRRDGGERESITVLNFSGEEAEFELPGDKCVKEWILGNYEVLPKEKPGAGVVKLRPWEGLLGLL
ncbi:hypothetical protein VTK56DRAFT_6684 [Thermocarpiscus australiensis]